MERKMWPIWKCGKCGIEFGELTQHPQAPNQCPTCLANIQAVGANVIPEVLAEEPAAAEQDAEDVPAVTLGEEEAN